MSFISKLWKDRVSDYPNKRKLTKEDGTSETVTVERAEGDIVVAGDAFNAENMNDLETRIQNGFNAVEQAQAELNEKMESVKKIYQGSKAWNLGSNPMSDIGLYTTGEIKKLMNISEFDELKFCCLVTNGDYGANPFIVSGTYIKDGILQVKSDPAVKESVRFNYVFSYGV